MNRMRKATLLLLVGLLSLLALAACGETAQSHFQKGNELNQTGEYAKAAEEYEKALELEPDYVDAMTNLGVTYYRLQQLDKAIEVYTRAIAVAPEDADIRSNLAAAYVQTYEPGGPTEPLDLALEQYQKAVELAPDLIQAHFGLGVVYSMLGQTEEAIAALETFQELDKGEDPQATESAQSMLDQLRGQ